MKEEAFPNQLFVMNAQTSANTVCFPANGNNIPMQDPTVEDLNRVISPSSVVFSGVNEGSAATPPQLDAGVRPFGTHLREGVEIVKDWLHRK